MTTIERVVQESSNIRTFFFRDEMSLEALPGQFAMVWLAGAGEFPMSLSLPSSSGRAGITVKTMGEGSKKLYECKEGYKIGLRGPYGNSFDLSKIREGKNKVLLVGGGTGMVPMVVLAKALSKLKAVRTSMVVGARTKGELPFLGISKRLLGSERVFPATDDGSLGFRGLAHEKVEELLSQDSSDAIFSCGPEKMMRAVCDIAVRNRVPAQFSLERIMKCGIGICGSCTIGDVVLCKDGPVLSSSQLMKYKNEFGVAHRDKTGTLRAF
jgi:dihydroorotate dehydrogenase electron transfer subunit